MPEYKGCGWVVLLAWRNVTLMLLKNVVFFGWAAHRWKQYFAIFSTQFSNQLCEVIFKYFGGHPRICISFIFIDSLLTFWNNMSSIFSNYWSGCFITAIFIACEEHGNPLFRFSTTMTEASLKIEDFLVCRLRNGLVSSALFMSHRSLPSISCNGW
jgi:hypothetical protein